MLTLSTTQVWVHDEDEALAFWTEKIGLEVRQDVTVAELGNFRWLTVGVPGEVTEIVLMAIPGAPMFDDATQAEIRGLMAKGLTTALFFTTDDVRKSYEELSAKGVEFTEKPEQRPYGIDCGFRDPSGNSYRLTQMLPE